MGQVRIFDLKNNLLDYDYFNKNLAYLTDSFLIIGDFKLPVEEFEYVFTTTINYSIGLLLLNRSGRVAFVCSQ
ncbi:hypothetical protein HERIO_880 [Hepatospora eriocheir]|nr:hypothetical protein HERIO_880 [Hepatospora eriocheir]